MMTMMIRSTTRRRRRTCCSRIIIGKDNRDEHVDQEGNIGNGTTTVHQHHLLSVPQGRRRRRRRRVRSRRPCRCCNPFPLQVHVLVVMIFFCLFLFANTSSPSNGCCHAFIIMISTTPPALPPQQKTTTTTRRTMILHHDDDHPANRRNQPTITTTTTCTTPFSTMRTTSSTSSSTSTALFMSLRSIMMEPETDSKKQNNPKVVLVGGKGGVGKTTISSAMAVHMASSSALKTLIVSTDPAHSLGDCLDIDLSSQSSNGQQEQQQTVIQLTDSLTQGNLYGMEIDCSQALDSFQELLSEFNVQKLADALQVSPEILENLGLQEFSNLLHNPPPGLDEFIALSQVFSQLDDYDIVIVDTAPTGHTLRLLQLPVFLDGFLGKLIQLRMKLSSISNTLQAFLGKGDDARQRQNVIDNALQKLEDFKVKMQNIQNILTDAQKCQFVVVTVPTILGVAETKRLINELSTGKQNIDVSDIVVNQCLIDSSSGDKNNDDDKNSDENNEASNKAIMKLHQYLERRQLGQIQWITTLTETCDDISNSPEYQNNAGGNIAITKVPFWDVELVGVAALGYVGQQVFVDNASFEHLLLEDNTNDDKDNDTPKVVICGGKGGVGKTTTATSLAITMAAKGGHDVALISTDPAHSLGDAVDTKLSGKLQDLPLLGVPNDCGEGSLSVMEVDPTASLNQFKGVVDQLMGNNGDDAAGSTTPAGNMPGLRDTLKDLQEVFDTLPAGTDEVVALAQIVNIVKHGKYDRIVLDTAPTGHTLRMLSTPGFLADLIERLLKISDKINEFTAIKMFLQSKTNTDIDAAVQTAKSNLLKFQFQMYDLEDLFSDAENTEFLIVTVPTELATRESIRLLNDLTFEEPPLKVRNVVINQVLEKSDNNSDNEDAFLSHVTHSQNAAMTDLEQYCASQQQQQQQQGTTTRRIELTRVPYLDTEPRGVFGLKVLADTLLLSRNKVTLQKQ